MFHCHYIGITPKYFYIQNCSDLSSSTFFDKNSSFKITKVGAFFYISWRLLLYQVCKNVKTCDLLKLNIFLVQSRSRTTKKQEHILQSKILTSTYSIFFMCKCIFPKRALLKKQVWKSMIYTKKF